MKISDRCNAYIYDLLMLYLNCVQRVTRPRGGINEWLHWLPVSLHKKLNYIIRQIYGYSRLFVTTQGEKVPIALENGGNVGLTSILEADAKQIVTLARETYEKYILFLTLGFCDCFIFYILAGTKATSFSSVLRSGILSSYYTYPLHSI